MIFTINNGDIESAQHASSVYFVFIGYTQKTVYCVNCMGFPTDEERCTSEHPNCNYGSWQHGVVA